MKYNNRLLVTGGAGFIGSAFLRNLVPKYPDWFFVNLDLLTYAGDLKKVESIANYSNYLFIHGDICDRKLVEEIFEENDINWVVNFAAESHVDNSIKDSKSFIQTNIAGTHNLLDVVKTSWKLDGMTKPKEKYRFLQISTDEVYGSLGFEEDSWVESDPLLPNSPYAASKASAELICRAYYMTYKLPIITTRSSNNFGPYQNKEKFMPTIILSILEGNDIPIYGNGNNVRDWIYVDDNIDLLELVLTHGKVGESYNIGGNNELSNLALAKFVISRFGESSSFLKPVEDRLGHDLRYSVNREKLNSIGEYKYTPFFYSIDKTIKHYMTELIK